MQQIFLVIISLLAAGYALFSKQFRTALGFLILAGSFTLSIPDLTKGLNTQIFAAISMIVFLFGAIVIVYKKRPKSQVDDESPKKGAQA